MGSGTITEASGKTSASNDINQLIAALKDHLVPRNASGEAEDVAGSLGSASQFFRESFATQATIDNDSESLQIEANSDDQLKFNDGSNDVLKLGKHTETTNGTNPGLFGFCFSAKNSVSTTSSTFSTAFSGTITTSGRPVEACLVPGPVGAGSAKVRFAADNGDKKATFRFIQGASQLSDDFALSCDGQGPLGSFSFNVYPVSIIRAILFIGAGTHTINLQYKVNFSTLYIDNSRLLLREL